MTPPDFTPAGYVALLRAFAERGYRFVDLSDLAPGTRALALRHDVDFSLARAVEMARLDASCGVRAEYFVLLGSEFYNPLSALGRRAIAEIMNLGHAIGLHYDWSVHPEGADHDASAAAECAVLEGVTGRRVETISFHRPAKELLGRAAPLAGRRHTYMPAYFERVGYCTDSEGRWRYHHPLRHPAVEAGDSLHLVIHPIWWTDELQGAVAKIDSLLIGRAAALREAAAANCKPYAAHLAAAPR